MRRRSIIAVIAIVITLICTSGTTLALMLHHIPTFYLGSQIADPDQRACKSRECVQRSFDLWNDVGNGLPWEKEFLAEHVNGYFQDDEGKASAGFIELPENVHDVRIAFDQDRARIGFRYGAGWWSSIISVEVRIWLVAKKTNVVALELISFRAGALPLGTQALLDFITEAARQQNIDVTWYRHDGHPVALLHFQANQVRPNTLLRRLEIQSGRIVIAGSKPGEIDQGPE